VVGSGEFRVAMSQVATPVVVVPVLSHGAAWRVSPTCPTNGCHRSGDGQLEADLLMDNRSRCVPPRVRRARLWRVATTTVGSKES
jgi:hypothetical protein